MMSRSNEILFPMLEALRPCERLLPSEWAERDLVLPRDSNARPGKLRLTRAQRGMVDAIADPGVREVVFMTSAQVGKSLAINAVLGWSISGEAGPHMIVRPDEADATAWVRETLDPLIQATPALKRIIGTGTKGRDGVGFKSFPGGSLAVVSSYKASALAGRSIRVGLLDEVDRFAPIVSGGEGEPVSIARKRLLTFRNSVLILASTPTLKQTSRIAQHYARGDQRQFHVPCLDCGTLDHISQSRLSFEEGRPQTARLVCQHCQHRATETERLRMLEKGVWMPTAEGEPGVVSFHINELASEFSSLQRVAAQVDSAKTLEARKVLQNTVFGLPFDSNTEIENDASALQGRSETIAAPFPSAIERVTCGVDCQSNRLEAIYLAHGKSGERWLLDRIICNGDTSGDLPWRALDDVLGAHFKLKDGRVLTLSATAIDAGFNTTRVVEFVARQRQRGRRVWPIFGRAGWDRPILKEGSRVKGLMRSLTVGVDNVKLEVMKALALSEPGPSYIHLPNHLDANAFDELASERLEVTYRRGYPKQEWIKDTHVRNELLDCLVYASAISKLPSAAPRNANQPKDQTIAELAAKLNATSNSKGLH